MNADPGSLRTDFSECAREACLQAKILVKATSTYTCSYHRQPKLASLENL